MTGEKKLRDITLDDKSKSINFESTYPVREGVDCDIYSFAYDNDRDLAVIHVEPGYNTPLHRVLQGLHTIEHYVSGEGRLVVGSPGEEDKVYEFTGHEEAHGIEVSIGQTMQWHAGATGLVFAEVCEPPYQEGRFEDLPE